MLLIMFFVFDFLFLILCDFGWFVCWWVGVDGGGIFIWVMVVDDNGCIFGCGEVGVLVLGQGVEQVWCYVVEVIVCVSVLGLEFKDCVFGFGLFGIGVLV